MRAPLALLFAAAVAAGAAGCAGQIPPPMDADALRAQERWPGTTVAELTQGRSLYIDHCSGCHSLYRPASQPAREWAAIVTEMADRAKLDTDRSHAVIRYLTAMATR
jgi:mono/diheme cytochrome c family protein